MRLTRRDALKALVVGGGVAGSSLAASELYVEHSESRARATLSDEDVETMLAVAAVIYPSEVEPTTAFVETYTNRLDDTRTAGLTDTIARLDDVAVANYGRRFAEIDSRSERDGVLRSMGVHRVQSRPDGTVPERVRYHLVNSLLYALFTSPKGSTLVGIESPAGHPGGFAHYREDSS